MASQHETHRRFDPLRGKWILVSPHRARRPWQGQSEAAEPESTPAHDPACHLCPGNTRVGGEVNPAYAGPWVFPNDFAALGGEPQPAGAQEPSAHEDDLLVSMPASGACKVICYSPRHDLTLPQLPADERLALVRLWCEETAAMGRTWRWVQLFENKGAAMGCSSPHPHGQVWATDHIPDEAATEHARQARWFQRHGRDLLGDVLQRELAGGERLVCTNDEWVALVPWWAAWPFETLLLPRRQFQRLDALDDAARTALADILGDLTTRYDNLFSCSFPYSMGWHGAPFGPGDDPRGWRVHAHFYPPLLRSATVRKFMVGYELLAEAQRDMTPEQAAALLRATSTRHFRTPRT